MRNQIPTGNSSTAPSSASSAQDPGNPTALLAETKKILEPYVGRLNVKPANHNLARWDETYKAVKDLVKKNAIDAATLKSDLHMLLISITLLSTD